MSQIILTERGIQRRMNLSFRESIANQPWTKFVRKVSSNQPQGEYYHGTDPLSGIREVKGEFQFDTLTAHKFHIMHREWEHGFTIPRVDWIHNKTDEAFQKASDMGALAAAHPGVLTEELLTAIKTTVDPVETTVYIASAAHPLLSGSTQTNLLGVGDYACLNVTDPTAPTDNEWAAALIHVAVHMQMLTDVQGNYINRGLRAFTVCVPKGLYPSLVQALNREFVNGGETNALKASGLSFTPMLLPSWTETDEFIMIANGKSPIIYQELEGPTNPDVLGPGTEYFRIRKRALVKTYAAYNVGYDRWEHICHATLT